jgi:hypothetical protein
MENIKTYPKVDLILNIMLVCTIIWAIFSFYNIFNEINRVNTERDLFYNKMHKKLGTTLIINDTLIIIKFDTTKAMFQLSNKMWVDTNYVNFFK